MADPIDWPPRRSSPRRRGLILVIVLIVALFLSASTTLSYYVDALWFSSLGYSAVFWRTLNFQAVAFIAFTLLTFAALYGSFLLFKPESLADLTTGRRVSV